jgi:type II secretory pathway pseudopilin PulG
MPFGLSFKWGKGEVMQRIRNRAVHDESGLGLIEIVVAMLILALLAVSFLPILIQGVKTGALNATRATAGQIAQQQIENAKALDPDCSTITALAAQPVSPVTDPRNVLLTITKAAGACPATYPGTMSYTVTVTNGSTLQTIITTKTLLYVETA